MRFTKLLSLVFLIITFPALADEKADAGKVEGTLFGLAIGDALGTTIEFRARDTYEPIADMIGDGPF